jgi:L-ribulokinase
VAAGAQAGGYHAFPEAQSRMTSLKDQTFIPDPAASRIYDELYGMYRELHDVFGAVPHAAADLRSLMKRLLDLRERVVGEAA